MLESVVPGPSRSGSGTPFLPQRLSSDARSRLFCFHHAGGSAAAFGALRRALAPRVEVVGVQLAGREGRREHVLPADMRQVVAELDAHLDPHLTGAFAFYGHSMGALIAHDLAVRRQARGATGPQRLIAGACRPPHVPAAFATQYGESDEVLVKTMLDIGGLSPELLDYPDWLRPALALTRGDLRLCASRSTGLTEPLACPVDAFHGRADPLVTEDDMGGWAGRTTAGFAVHRFDGGHFFFLREAPGAFAARLAELVTAPVLRTGISSL